MTLLTTMGAYAGFLVRSGKPDVKAAPDPGISYGGGEGCSPGLYAKRVHSAPTLSCSTASLTFVRTTECSGLLSMTQHVICRSLSVACALLGRGRGAAFHMRWGGRPPPPPSTKAMLDPRLRTRYGWGFFGATRDNIYYLWRHQLSSDRGRV